MNILDWLTMILVIIGGLNWGLVGFFEYDLVAEIFGDMSTVSKVIYDLVGVAALYMVISLLMKGSGKANAAPTV